MTNNTTKKKVLINTLALYVRMLFLTIISLFTYRVIFQCLGASDFGTYNVVGGFVSLFGFISGTLTIASQRYFSIGLANNDWSEVNKSFSVNIIIYILLLLIIFAFAESIGLWFVLSKLNLDYSQFTEIMVIYQTSVFIFLSGLFISPFLALLVADENITIYTWISIIEGILKILVAYLLYVSAENKLIVYSFLLLFVSLIINAFYILYCLKKYKQLKFIFCNEKERYKSIFTFINWNLIGAIAAVGKNQGINIIINIFFGTLINAARAIAFQLNAVISSFAQNFMKAIDPRIMKAYARGEKTEFIGLVYISSKISYFLLMIITIPFIFNAEYILKLWLGSIPDYTVIFVTLALVDTLVLSITDPFLTAVQAIGKMRGYQLTVGFLSLLNLPISFIALYVTKNALMPFIVAIVIDVFINIARLLNFKILYQFSILNYLSYICIPATFASAFSVFLAYYFFSEASSFIEFLKNVIFSEITMISLIIIIGLNKKERNMLKKIISIKRNY